MSVVADYNVRYFDSGATKHITLQRHLFTSPKSASIGNSFPCANNSSYLVNGAGQNVLIATNGGSFILVDAF